MFLKIPSKKQSDIDITSYLQRTLELLWKVQSILIKIKTKIILYKPNHTKNRLTNYSPFPHTSLNIQLKQNETPSLPCHTGKKSVPRAARSSSRCWFLSALCTRELRRWRGGTRETIPLLPNASSILQFTRCWSPFIKNINFGNS